MISKKELFIIGIAVVLMVSLLLAGINLGRGFEQPIEDDGMKIIRVWGAIPENAGPAQMILNFNRTFKEQGIQAEYCYYSNTESGNKGMESTLLSGSKIDVYFTYDIARLENRAVNHMAVDLSGYLKRDGISLTDYYNIDVTSYYMNGKPYGIPTKLDQYGITINKDMFERAGIEIPKQWDYEEFRKIALRLTSGDGNEKTYGMFFCTQQNLGYLLDFLLPCSIGSNPLYGSDGLSNFQSESLHELMELVNKMMNEDGSSPTHEDSVTRKLTQESMFLSERCAMTIGPWIIRSVKDMENYPHSFTTAFVPYPVADKDGMKYEQGGLGDFLSISPNSKFIDESFEFIKWYTTTGILSMVEGGRIPAYKGFSVDELTELLLKNSHGLIDEESAREVLILPKEKYATSTVTYKISDLYGIARDEFEQILTGKKSVSQGLESAKRQGDIILMGE